MDRVCDLLIGEMFVHIDQGRKAGGRTGAVAPMADAALVLIDALPQTRCRFIRRKGPGPYHFIGVDIEYASGGIDSRSAPFTAAPESGKNDRLLIESKRDELPRATICL